jgi:hypothetical protein
MGRGAAIGAGLVAAATAAAPAHADPERDVGVRVHLGPTFVDLSEASPLATAVRYEAAGMRLGASTAYPLHRALSGHVLGFADLGGRACVTDDCRVRSRALILAAGIGLTLEDRRRAVYVAPSLWGGQVRLPAAPELHHPSAAWLGLDLRLGKEWPAGGGWSLGGSLQLTIGWSTASLGPEQLVAYGLALTIAHR